MRGPRRRSAMSTRYAESLAAALVLLLTACASQTPAPSTTESSAATANLQAQPAAAPISDDVRRAYEAAQTSMQAGDWDSAGRALEPIVNEHPELPGPAVNLGIVYVHLNRTDE